MCSRSSAGASGGDLPDEVRTYADLHANANRIAAALIAHGMAPGDRFALVMRNHPEFVETMIAVVDHRLRVRAHRPTHARREAGVYAAPVRCRGVICADYCVAQVDAVRASVPALKWILALTTGEASEPSSAWRIPTSLNEALAQPAPTVDVRLSGLDDPLQIIYTSGTTGDPKGVVFANARFGAFALVGMLFGYRADDRPYTGLSLTHGNAQAVTLGPSLHMGLRAVFSRRFTKTRLWDICRRYGCTTFSMLGGMATAIYSEPPRPNDADNPVRMVLDAGMPGALTADFERRFGVQVLEWYGAVEGGLALKPIGEGPLADDELALLAKAVGHPARVRILRILSRKEARVCSQIVGELPLAQSTVSEHLRILKEAGLIRSREDGPRIGYCINYPVLRRLKGAGGFRLVSSKVDSEMRER